jgi:1-acyl-sn-glycerol-3-phosphate acyltransferase
MIGAFAAHSIVGRAFIKGESARRRYYVNQTSRYCRAGLKVLGVETSLSGFDAARFARSNYLFVGNHMSYLDILIMSAALPSVFVTSVDMGEAPVLGDLAELGGSIFVERRNRSQVERDLSSMTNALREGFNVVIYPEGTSTDGQRILPFKKSLLMAAVQAGRDIQPFCLRYLEIDGQPFGPANHDKVCWYDSAGFAPHLMGLVGTKCVKAEICFLEPVAVTPESTRGELAEICYERISAAYFKGRESLRAG